MHGTSQPRPSTRARFLPRKQSRQTRQISFPVHAAFRRLMHKPGQYSLAKRPPPGLTWSAGHNLPVMKNPVHGHRSIANDVKHELVQWSGSAPHHDSRSLGRLHQKAGRPLELPCTCMQRGLGCRLWVASLRTAWFPF